MPTLRQIVDGKTFLAAGPLPPKPKAPAQPANGNGVSPAAYHVASHIQDPFGATKDQLDQLNRAKMEYELQKHSAVMQLKPVEDVVQGIKNQHQLHDPSGSANPQAMMMNPDLAQAGQFGPETPQDGTASQIDPLTGNPSNMSQTPGQMNMNRPSQAGFSPGVSPGPAQTVRPSKMGVPGPGQGNVGQRAGMPSGWGPPGPSHGDSFGPTAAPPRGSGQLPGAKGPGDPKVAGPIKKAQGKKPGASNNGGSRPIRIQVHADRSTGAPMPLAGAVGIAKLRGYGTSEGVSKAWESRDRGKGGEKVNPLGFFPGSGRGFLKPAEKTGAPESSVGGVKRNTADLRKDLDKLEKLQRTGRFGEGAKSREPWGYLDARRMTGGVFHPTRKMSARKK